MHFSLQPNPSPQFRRRKPVPTHKPSNGAEMGGADGAAAGSPEAKLETGGSDGQGDTGTNASEGKAEVAGAGPQHAGEADVKPADVEPADGETLSSLATALHESLADSLPEVEPKRLQQIAQSLAQQAQAIRPTGIDTDFEQGKTDYEAKSMQMMQQMTTMQNLSLKSEQMMKIAEMIAKIAKKAIENYDVK